MEMEWTWRRTFIGLGVAVLLGVLALTVDAIFRAQREEIIASGHRIAARVVDERHDFFSRRDMSVVEYPIDGRPHRTEISDPWGYSLDLGSWVELYVAPSDPDRVATSDGYSSLPGRTAPFSLTIFAAIAAFVAISGRATTVFRERKQPPSVKPRWAPIIVAAASLAGFAWLTFEVFTGRIS